MKKNKVAEVLKKFEGYWEEPDMFGLQYKGFGICFRYDVKFPLNGIVIYEDHRCTFGFDNYTDFETWLLINGIPVKEPVQLLLFACGDSL